MAKHYGDIPCVNITSTIHITKSATECLCGASWKYGVVYRNGTSNNIIWRSLEGVSCTKCKDLYKED